MTAEIWKQDPDINECKSILKQGLNWFSNVNDFIKEYIK